MFYKPIYKKVRGVNATHAVVIDDNNKIAPAALAGATEAMLNLII